jgi:hypothetical protein
MGAGSERAGGGSETDITIRAKRYKNTTCHYTLSTIEIGGMLQNIVWCMLQVIVYIKYNNALLKNKINDSN